MHLKPWTNPLLLHHHQLLHNLHQQTHQNPDTDSWKERIDPSTKSSQTHTHYYCNETYSFPNLQSTNTAKRDRERKWGCKRSCLILTRYSSIYISRWERRVELRKKTKESHSNPRLVLSFALSFRPPPILSLCESIKVASWLWVCLLCA